MNITGQIVKKKWKDGIRVEVWSPPGEAHRVPFCEAKEAQYRETKLEEDFGPAWSTHWFQICLPKEGITEKTWFHWDSEAEGMVWTIDGQPVHGLSRHVRMDFPLQLVMKQGDESDKVVFYIELACNWLGGNGTEIGITPPDVNRRYKVTSCEMREFNNEALCLYYDMQILKDMAETFGEGDPRGKRALYTANKIINVFNHPDIGDMLTSIKEGGKIADEFLRPTNKSHTTPMVVTAVGNCHIDTAWLWRYEETRRKTARSFSSQMILMERHPQFIFAASQMQQFQWLNEDYPDLFKALLKRVKDGQFIPVGGSWVEMDGNLPCGESFVRQFLYGQNFMKKHFGEFSEIFWLPGN